jgi:hypothetical protein
MANIYTGPVPPIKQKDSELAQISLKVVQSSTNPAQLLFSALWSSPNEIYQIGARNRKTGEFRNIPVSSIDEACQLAQKFSVAGWEAYFAMAGFKTSANRQAANVSGASCFWLDIDCGEDKAKSGKGYPTLEDAGKGIDRFCATTGLPLPTHIINSGGGLHAYWALDTFIDREAWQAAATQLKALTHALSFLADDSRTADIASVLRIPGTLNNKYDPRRDVTQIHASPEPINAKTMLDAIEKAHNLLIKQPATQQKPVAVQIAKIGGENTGETAAFQKPPLDQNGGNWAIGRLAALLEPIDPEEGGRPAWIAISMALHHVTGGSDEGLELFNQWSAPGASYPGRRAIEVQWRSFNSNSEKRHNIGTIINRVRDAGYDWMEVISATEEQFQREDPEVVCQEVPTTDPAEAGPDDTGTPNPLDRFSLRGMSEIVARGAVGQKPILGGLAILGQATAIFAPPNSGKTLITLFGLCEDVRLEKVEASKVYYVNVDDSAQGLADKLAIADEYGFHMLSEGYRDFKVEVLLGIMDEMIAGDQATGVIVILDTIKKFTNLMDKTKASQFTKVVRRFVMKGGTVIGMAHTNKKLGIDGKPVYGGTSDLVDDFDCAYTIAAGLCPDANEKVVVFDNIKRRGSNPTRAAYRYSIESGLSYAELLATVAKLEDQELTSIAQETRQESDVIVIEAIRSSIGQGVTTKMLLAETAAKVAGVSRRQAMQVIERYTGLEPLQHKWHFTVGDRGAKVFSLLATTAKL